MNVKCCFSMNVKMKDLGSLRFVRDHIVGIWMVFWDPSGKYK